ncbi:DNA-directed RNA polymerase I subunit rpa49 [Ananas comosus]|uniref:DNA-directed RNA polymerase I subunit rpa49 n=1 Tax=Ananas comosus TaxID=4615 RepID=A0A199VWH0_ANACO|nr:DNA-directed RNA polymerase I subunit rpa49 [Ananas comosus]
MAEEAVETLTEPSTRKKRKRKALDVSMEALAESGDRIAPVVGYFPSGYDPLGGGAADPAAAADDPSVRVFRNKRRANRLELVVSPRGSAVEFVGRSYAGEAAAPQLCTYALGVLDKATQTLKIVPIAANKIFRLEPRLAVSQPAHMEASEGLTEESMATGQVGRKIQDLTSMYGTKKDRDKDKKWMSLNQQRNDPSAYEHLENEKTDADVDNNAADQETESTPRNIPPHNPSADTPERAYLIDEIIPKGERAYLLDILEALHSGVDLDLKPYPSFVSNRLYKLRELQDEEEKEKLACMLSYITHLQSFWERLSSSGRKSKHHSKPADHSKIPRITYQRLQRMFVDPESHLLSTQKNELLIGYILVLTLFVDNFKTDPTDVARDLKMTIQTLRPYYQQLGCKISRENFSEQSLVTLPAPLKFPELRRRRRR